MDGRKHLGRDHNRVEPGDAIGIAIRIPKDRARIVADLLAPSVSARYILDLPGAITLYATVGHDSLNGRPAAHRWVNVITDPPAGTPPEDGIGGLACIGAPTNAVNRMWWRHGLGRVPGRLSLVLDQVRLEARVRIVTAGGTIMASARFEATGEPWAVVPQHYYVLKPDGPVLLRGDEWGSWHDGSGSVSAWTEQRHEAFETQIGLDLDLGWDYVLGGP